MQFWVFCMNCPVPQWGNCSFPPPPPKKKNMTIARQMPGGMRTLGIDRATINIIFIMRDDKSMTTSIRGHKFWRPMSFFKNFITFLTSPSCGPLFKTECLNRWLQTGLCLFIIRLSSTAVPSLDDLDRGLM